MSPSSPARPTLNAFSESALMREHGTGLLVTKNSGGPMTAAKLTAARDLGVQVVMVARPALRAGGLGAWSRRVAGFADGSCDPAHARTKSRFNLKRFRSKVIARE